MSRPPDQLIEVLVNTSATLGSVDGGPYDNRFMPYPWNPRTHFRGIFLCVQEYVEELFSSRFSCFPMEIKVFLTRGDLLPRSILIGGFKSLTRIFPGPRQAASKIIRDLRRNNPYVD